MGTLFALPYLVLQWLRGAAINARRRERTGRYVLWSVLAGLASAAMLVIAAAFVGLLWWLSLWWLALAMAAVLGVPLIAGPLIRHVLVPAGWHRAAYQVALYSRPGPDPVAYALCVAAWTSRDPAAVAWVDARRDARQPLGDAEIAATALLAAGRGDAATARALLRSLPMIVESHPAVRELAGEWLACDAAERGAWAELCDPGRAAWPATPLGFLLEGIAARHTGAAGAPPARELWARWLIAPRRRATRALVIEALATASSGAPAGREPTAPGAPGSADVAEPMPGTADPPLPRAVAAHLALDARPATATGLALAVTAWDAALGDDATRAWLARRALELDAPLGAVERAIHDVAGAVTDELARLAEAAQLAAPPGAHGPVGGGLARRLRHGRLDALEAAFSRWAERRHDQTRHPSIDEWREFIALWTAYNAAVTAGGLELRRLAFPHAFGKGSNMAAWLWNKREEYALSHAISKWLLDEALAVGDTEAIELGHRNCALAVPTRLGRIQS
ncbi:MAG TPA: hypothetical protein VHW23_02180 [Kofleriaceae bacterium]|jgi:hypothetical protein|nr:hypothetical protein [Kofleriaceae bacterium]